MKLFKRLTSFGSALLLSLSSLFIFAPALTHAAADTCTWTGGGGDDNFTTAANWSGCDNSSVPESGDSLVFPAGATNSGDTLNNDLPGGTTIASITFSGAISTVTTSEYHITGNAVTLMGGITYSMTGNFSPFQNIDLPIELGANQTMTISSSSGNVTLSGVVSGSGNLIKSGSGTLNLTKSNTFTGTVTINAGLLGVSNPHGLGDTTAGTTVNNGGGLAISMDESNKNATVSEPLILNGSTATPFGSEAGILTVSVGCGFGACQESNIKLDGDITLGADVKVSTVNANAGNVVTITGALNGNHTIQLFNGDAGKLVIDSDDNNSQTPNGEQTAPVETITIEENDKSGAGLSVGANQTVILDGERGATFIALGGILKGSGKVTGLLTVGTGGTLAPGHSPGCLSSGNLILNGTFQVEIGGTDPCIGYDQAKVTGSVSVNGGTLEVSRFNDFKPAANQTYIIIDNDGSDATTDGVISTFTDLAEGATFEKDGFVFKISYVGGDGNDVTLTVVSVPATPDTGFSLLSNNPVATLITSTVLAGAILLIARRYGKATA